LNILYIEISRNNIFVIFRLGGLVSLFIQETKEDCWGSSS